MATRDLSTASGGAGVAPAKNVIPLRPGYSAPNSMADLRRMLAADDDSPLCREMSLADTTRFALDYPNRPQSPFSGRQEIIHFPGFLTYFWSRFDIHEDVSPPPLIGSGNIFIQFRLSGRSIEKIGDRPTETVSGPSVCIFTLPKGCERESVIQSGAVWETMTLCCELGYFRVHLAPVLPLLPATLGSFARGRSGDVYFKQAPLSSEQRMAIAEILDIRISQELRFHMIGVLLQRLICMTLDSLCRSDPPVAAEPALSERDVRRLSEARAILIEEYREPPTLYDLARRVALNRRKLAQGFKALFDITVYEFCIQQRMHNARRLLVEKTHNITQIADMVGYKDASSFTKAFKKHFSVLPKDVAALTAGRASNNVRSLRKSGD